MNSFYKEKMKEFSKTKREILNAHIQGYINAKTLGIKMREVDIAIAKLQSEYMSQGGL